MHAAALLCAAWRSPQYFSLSCVRFPFLVLLRVGHAQPSAWGVLNGPHVHRTSPPSQGCVSALSEFDVTMLNMLVLIFSGLPCLSAGWAFKWYLQGDVRARDNNALPGLPFLLVYALVEAAC